MCAHPGSEKQILEKAPPHWKRGGITRSMLGRYEQLQTSRALACARSVRGFAAFSVLFCSCVLRVFSFLRWSTENTYRVLCVYRPLTDTRVLDVVVRPPVRGARAADIDPTSSRSKNRTCSHHRARLGVAFSAGGSFSKRMPTWAW